MDRRNFIKFGTGAATAALVAPSFLFEGCVSTGIVNLINNILDAASKILNVVEPGATWVTAFTSAVQALKTVEATWENGGAVTIVDDALNTLLVIANAIPYTAPYADLIAVLVAGIEMVLAALPVSTTASLKSNATVTQSPYFGKVHIHPGFLQTRAGAFKKSWNGVALSNPALAKAAI